MGQWGEWTLFYQDSKFNLEDLWKGLLRPPGISRPCPDHWPRGQGNDRNFRMGLHFLVSKYTNHLEGSKPIQKEQACSFLRMSGFLNSNYQTQKILTLHVDPLTQARSEVEASAGQKKKKTRKPSVQSKSPHLRKSFAAQVQEFNHPGCRWIGTKFIQLPSNQEQYINFHKRPRCHVLRQESILQFEQLLSCPSNQETETLSIHFSEKVT